MPQNSDFYYIVAPDGRHWGSTGGWTHSGPKTLYQASNGDYEALMNIARGRGGRLVPMGEEGRGGLVSWVLTLFRK